MFYFNLLVWNINFHVHFWLLLSKVLFRGLFEKRAHQQKNFGRSNDPPAGRGCPNNMISDNRKMEFKFTTCHLARGVLRTPCQKH